MFGKKMNFDWVTSKEYREIMKADYREVGLCHRSEAYKACQVLTGSVMEAALSYGLMRIRVDFSPHASLHELLELAKKKGLLAQSSAYYGEAVRDYRNLIHPRKYICEKREISRESATMVMQTCEYMLSELGKQLATYLPLAMEACLLPVTGAPVPIYSSRFCIGRDQGNHLVIEDERVSGTHALIAYAANKFYLQDDNSKNGTYMLGADGKEKKLRAAKKQLLDSGDQFRLGKDGASLFTFMIEGQTIPH